MAFLDYARRYLDAYGDVATTSDRHPPRIQLIGQAIELSLKAFLAATQGTWPNGHDLLDLHDKCSKHGLTLDTNLQDEVLPNLSSLYHRGPGGSSWRFPTRYPNPNLNVWVIPNDAKLRLLLESIVEAKEAAPKSLGDFHYITTDPARRN